jgi:hypothetical protein
MKTVSRGRKKKGYKVLTSPCGMDCFNCAAYLANTNEELRKFVAMRAQVPLEEAVCAGCRPQCGIIKLFNAAEPCKVYKCISQKAKEYAEKWEKENPDSDENGEISAKTDIIDSKKTFKFCFDCDDFPCENLQPSADQAKYTPHNLKVFNLCLIKKYGLEKWANEFSEEIRNKYFNEPLDI